MAKGIVAQARHTNKCHPFTRGIKCLQEPTGAATIGEMEAIVVSKETIKGADEINTWRQAHGSALLTVVTVDLVGNQGSSTASKLSSTRLRNEEAQKSNSSRGLQLH